ncbi:hypothetical protein GPECTOR_9g487 [Gonium pectorale]|uniref:Uncharacterized protein n=1 Tax=Gonium pectorale TaxID=33097 RepID=A0A150GRM9_GONPE|nr:hypothetical protein GPECTOR_9g487 [Gonium pectorale]|eukprot:KXZ52443.1 hypothetical protein GPECTOR_9g487 [Gonium pectorale]
MCVNGMPTNVSYEVAKALDPEPGEAAELVELMRVWREEWYSFPQWKTVLETRSALRSLDGGLWGRLSGPQRRMMCEVTAVSGGGRGTELYALLLKRCALRQQSAASAAAPAARAGTEPLAEQHQGQDPQPSPEPQSDPVPDPMAEVIQAASRFRDGARQEDVEAARRNAAAHFPAAFVTPYFVSHFVEAHKLQGLPEWTGAQARGGDSGVSGGGGGDGEGGGSLPPLWAAVGCTRNLSTRQVWQRIVGPALEATHGMSYAEAFLSQVMSYDTFKPYSDMQFAAAIGHRNLQYTPVRRSGGDDGQQRHSASNPSLPDRYGILVPYNRDRWDDPFSQLAAALDDATSLGVLACTWVELFCSGAGPPPPRAAVPEAEREAAAAAVKAAAEAAAARCEAVAILAPADAWPLTAPLGAPPAASCAATTAVVLDAVRHHGIRVVTLRLKPPYWEKTGLRDPRAEVKGRQAALQALEEAEEPPPVALPPGGAANAVSSGSQPTAEAVRELWRLYRSGTKDLLEQEIASFGKGVGAFGYDSNQSRLAALATIVAERAADAAATAALLGPPYGNAVVRITREARLEGLPRDGGAAAAAAADAPDGAVVLAEAVLDEQLLRCPVGMTQAEADDLVRVWATEWAWMPDLATVMLTWAACGGGGSHDGSGDESMWARMSYDQRRTSCELVLLYGSRAAALATARMIAAKQPPVGTHEESRRLPPWPEPVVSPAAAAQWRPAPAAEAEAKAASSRGHFVTVEFLEHFMAVHNLDGGRGLLGTYPGQAVWNPCCDTAGVTTSWGYGMGYSDLLLSAEAQEALLPHARDGRKRAYCMAAETAPERAFASHAWATPFVEFAKTLAKVTKNAYWIDIFHKNQHQSVAISDLADNLRLGGQVALVVHPFPAPLVLSRVWCLFEIMTALQVGVPIRLFSSPKAMGGFESKLVRGSTGLDGMATVEITPEVLQEVDAIDVSTAQATVASDKELILGMIRDSMGVDEMNRQVKELFKSLLVVVREELENKQMEIMAALCFAGNGLVPTVVASRAVHTSNTRIGAPACTAGIRSGMPYNAAAASGAGPQGSAVVLRHAAELRPGDVVVTADGGLSRVVLVTRDEQQQQLLVTPDHPVQLGGVWVLPRSVAPVVRMAREQVPYGAVYNLELDPPATLLVSGLRLVALGQVLRGEPSVGLAPESCAQDTTAAMVAVLRVRDRAGKAASRQRRRVA